MEEKKQTWIGQCPSLAYQNKKKRFMGWRTGGQANDNVVCSSNPNKKRKRV